MFRAKHGLALAILVACSSPPGSSAHDASALTVPPHEVSGASFDATLPDAIPAMPDLTINRERAIVDLAIEQRTFEANACELDPVENCVGGPGLRTLLRFAVETPNVGTADMVLGTPSAENPQFEYSSCHNHYHFLGYAEYELRDGSGNLAAMGQKQAFCLLDSQKYVLDDPTVADIGTYNCFFQGIQRGWSDVYHSRLACQWIDVTNVPNGDYTLEIRLNNGGTLPELRYDNNAVSIPVTIGDPNISTPTEECDLSFDRRSLDGEHRECGWDHAGTFDCTPGQMVRAGCAQSCGFGSCVGDPILRVCDNARPDGNCSYAGNTAFDDDACNSKCPRTPQFECPASGKVDVYSAPYNVDDAYSCTVEVK